MSLAWYAVMFLMCIVLHGILAWAGFANEIFTIKWFIKCVVVGLVAAFVANLVV